MEPVDPTTVANLRAKVTAIRLTKQGTPGNRAQRRAAERNARHEAKACATRGHLTKTGYDECTRCGVIPA